MCTYDCVNIALACISVCLSFFQDSLLSFPPISLTFDPLSSETGQLLRMLWCWHHMSRPGVQSLRPRHSWLVHGYNTMTLIDTSIFLFCGYSDYLGPILYNPCVSFAPSTSHWFIWSQGDHEWSNKINIENFVGFPAKEPIGSVGGGTILLGKKQILLPYWIWTGWEVFCMVLARPIGTHRNTKSLTRKITLYICIYIKCK